MDSRSSWKTVPVGTRLHIGNLDFSTTYEELEGIFSKYANGGRLAEPIAYKNSGYAFVQYETIEEAQAALNTENGTNLRGRRISVSVAKAAMDEDLPRHDDYRGGPGVGRGGFRGGDRDYRDRDYRESSQMDPRSDRGFRQPFERKRPRSPSPNPEEKRRIELENRIKQLMDAGVPLPDELKQLFQQSGGSGGQPEDRVPPPRDDRRDSFDSGRGPRGGRGGFGGGFSDRGERGGYRGGRGGRGDYERGPRGSGWDRRDEGPPPPRDVRDVRDVRDRGFPDRSPPRGGPRGGFDQPPPRPSGPSQAPPPETILHVNIFYNHSALSPYADSIRKEFRDAGIDCDVRLVDTQTLRDRADEPPSIRDRYNAYIKKRNEEHKNVSFKGWNLRADRPEVPADITVREAIGFILGQENIDREEARSRLMAKQMAPPMPPMGLGMGGMGGPGMSMGGMGGNMPPIPSGLGGMPPPFLGGPAPLPADRMPPIPQFPPPLPSGPVPGSMMPGGGFQPQGGVPPSYGAPQQQQPVSHTAPAAPAGQANPDSNTAISNLLMKLISSIPQGAQQQPQQHGAAPTAPPPALPTHQPSHMGYGGSYGAMGGQPQVPPTQSSPMYGSQPQMAGDASSQAPSASNLFNLISQLKQTQQQQQQQPPQQQHPPHTYGQSYPGQYSR